MRRPYTMDKLTFLVLFVYSAVFLQLCGGTSKPETVNRGYVFTAPKVLLAGEIESGCLSLHNLEPPAYVLLELLSFESTKEVLANTSSVIETGTETCLELMVPSTENSSGWLRLTIKFDKHPDYVVTSEEKVEIAHDSLVTFVETDKPIYKPGQDVNIRILTLKHDLKPWMKSIPKVWISNPSKIRVAQWTNVSTENGMAQLVFPLSLEPNLGTWEIKVQKNRLYTELHTTTFKVKKYVLPRFQLTINSPGYILADAENVTWNICAKYSYGKPVKGTLKLKASSETASWRTKSYSAPNLAEIHHLKHVESSDGCTEFVVIGKDLGLMHYEDDPNNIVLTANFTEAGTEVVETAISRTRVVHEALKLEFERYTPIYFKPGLPYHGKLRVLRLDNTPAPNEKIFVCLENRIVECRNFKSSTDGFIDFIVPPLQKNEMTLVATATNYVTKYYSPDIRWKLLMTQPTKYFRVKPWYSPSGSYLTVTQGYRPIVCGEKYSFNVMYTIPASSSVEPISFHYSINSKGDLLIHGHVKHKPSRETILNHSELYNVLGIFRSPANKTDQASVVHRFPLSVKITPSMAPVSELLLYYVRADGEVVATTYKIEVGNCFENKVKSVWHTDVRTPGATTQYHVEAAPWSLCGISAIDKSILFLDGSKSNLIDAERTFDQFKRFHPTPETNLMWRHCKSITPENTKGEVAHLPTPQMTFQNPFMRLRRRTLRMRYSFRNYIDYVDTSQAFNDFGVIVMSDLVLETRPCPELDDLIPADYLHSQRFHLYHQSAFATAFPLTSTNFRRLQVMALPEQAYQAQLLDQTATIRSYFPETWLWELVPTGKEGKVTIERTLPHTITDWVGYTTCISPIHGIGIAPPTTITAFQPFFLDYSLPYSVKRGEMLRMKVSLFNYMQHNLPVKIKLTDAPGLDLYLSQPSASFCVKPRDSVVHEYILRPRVIGEVNITVSASIDSDYPGLCGPETLLFTRDIIVKPILILPEGFPMEVTKSAFLCPKNFRDDSMVVWDLMLPENVVPDSGRAYINLMGDALGPALENLDNLVQLPVGCGEQNMVLLVPNIHVIKYLDVAGIQNSALRARAIKNMEEGYQRELNFRHLDGSYSAFGPSSKSESSIWLTAFVLKSFAQAQNLIDIDDFDLRLSAAWIMDKQLENGCFPVIGTVFHKQMKGGLQEDDSSSSLTAYILISLLQSNVCLTCPLWTSVIQKALHCIEKGIADNPNNSYALALSTYALALLDHPKVKSSMKSLMDLSVQHNNLLWWEDKTKSSLSLSIEITAYAILTLVKLEGDENMVNALKAVRWLSKQRNAEGGFVSTQDTILGLEAITKYAAAMKSNNTDLSVLVIAGVKDQVYRIDNDNRLVLTQIRLPVLPTFVEIFAEGEGCVLVQSNIKYNVAHINGSEAFDLTVQTKSMPYANECSMQKITVCGQYKMADEESNMALIEIGMISGYVPNKASLHALLEDPSSRVKRFEDSSDIVSIYFDKLTHEKTCISFTVVRDVLVDRLEPANVKLYDYYHRELTISKSYNFPPICSSAEPTEEQPVNSVTNDDFSIPQVESGSGLTSDESDTTLKPFITNFESAMRTSDNVDNPTSFVKETENTKFPVNASFVINHEMEMPEGVEGPKPVYVRPDTIEYKTETPVGTNELSDLASTPETERQNTSQETDDRIKTATNDEMSLSSPTIVKQSCPICLDKLPSDISNVYCSARSAVKVAIRRMHKTRLLLDLHASRDVLRLRGAIEFALNPNCTCAPLDSPGSFALIINKNDDFIESGDYKQVLNDSFYIYGLASISGEPSEVTETRSTCSNQSTYVDPPVGG